MGDIEAMNRRLTLGAALLAACVVGAAAHASAQSPTAQVVDLNRQAMNAYQNLEVEQAQELLERALQTAQRGRVQGAPLARTYLNLGVLAVGGLGDNGRGLQYFVQALRADPNVALDPLTSTPEIQTVFNLARQQAGTGGGNTGDTGGGNTGGNTGGGNTGTTGGGNTGTSGGAGGTIPHMPVPEQLAQTAVPVYIEVPGNVAHVYLYYKGHGMREFRRVEMQRVADGYGYEVPCTDVFQPSLEYYIVAFAGDGSPLGFAGTQAQPVTVRIVGSRTQPAPALPGRAPPETCREQECPPGMAGCNARGGGAGMGSTCRVDGDCGSGLVCRDDLCVSDGGGGGGGGGGDDVLPRFFFRAGLGAALGFVQDGMLADDVRPGEERFDAGGQSLGPRPDAPHTPDAWVTGGNCPLDSYCVRVAQPGFVPNLAIRFAVGYYFLDWLGAAAFVRFAPFSGYGDLSFMLLGARLQIRPLADMERQNGGTGPSLSVHAGVSIGQVQHQPPGNGDNAPWVISGMAGVPFGVTFVYRFSKNFGLYAEAEAMFQFPSFMFNADISGGLEVGF